jgi:flagellar hook-associated protein 3 FlgL
MVDRLSTKQLYSIFNRNILSNQEQYAKSADKLNSGRNFIKSYDDPRASTLSIDLAGRINNQTEEQDIRNLIQSDLEIAENAVSGMKDFMDRVREIAIQASNDTISGDERDNMRTEIRNIGNTLIQIANTKSNGKYIFSGEQSDLTTFKLGDDLADFSDVVYKESLDNSREKNIQGVQTTYSIKDAFISEAGSASIPGRQINPAITAIGGNLDFSLNGGNDNKFNFTVALAPGDDLATTIGKINAAYNAVGGVGTVAQEAPQFHLNLDTALMTGSSPNKKAEISILKSSDGQVLDDLGLTANRQNGEEKGLMHVLSDFENALLSDDREGINLILDNIKANIDQLLEIRSDIGLGTAQLENLNVINDNKKIQLQTSLSRVEDVDFVSSTIELNASQARLNSSIQVASSFFQTSLSGFLG